jgi:hypothetical protein
MKKIILSTVFVTICAFSAIAQVANLQPSPAASVAQTVGDTNLSITYHRPSVKGRKIWGDLVPYAQAWRMGANEATLFESSMDVTINGQKLAAGKYAIFAIPTAGDWTLIFNKKFDQWGTEYEKNKADDVLKVTVKPVATADSVESLNYEFVTVSPTAAEVHMKWEKIKLPFTVSIGDVNGRLLAKHRDAVAAAKADDFRTPAAAAGFVLGSKLKDNYADAMTWIDKSLAAKETFGNLRTKAQLAAEMGNTKDAITWGEKALAVGKATTPPVNSEAMAMFEKQVADWKAKK